MKNSGVYQTFVNQLDNTEYRNLFQIARKERLWSVFREQDDMGKICKVLIPHIGQQAHNRDRFDLYNPASLATTFTTIPQQNRQEQFRQLFQTVTIHGNALDQHENKNIIINSSNKSSRRQSNNSRLVYQIPSISKRNSSTDSDNNHKMDTAFETIEPFVRNQQQHTTTTRSKSRKGRPTITRPYPARITKQYQLAQTMPNRIEYNETQLSLLKQLVMNISGYEHKGYFYITIDQFTRYLTKRFPQQLVNKLCEFLEIPSKMDLQQYIDLVSKLNIWKHQDILFLSFFLLDFNTDGVICPSDIFQLFKQSENQAAQRDFRLLAKVMIQKLKQEVKNLEKPVYPKFYHAPILTHTLYLRFSKQINTQIIKSKVKKDTMYHMGFYGLTHKHEQRIKELEFEKQIQHSPKRFTYQGELKSSPLGQIFENVELCSINFISFQEIYNNTLPHYFYEILQFLTLFELSGGLYDNTITTILALSKQEGKSDKI